MTKKIVFIIIFIFLFIILFGVYIYQKYVFVIPSNYDRSIYTVVLHNETDEELDNVSVSYVHAASNEPKVNFANISDLMANEYRKINIPTDYQEPGSYNVYVDVNTDNDKKTISAGYFGTNLGGFSVIEIKKENNTLILESLQKNTSKYNKIYRYHLKNQYETRWYE